MTALEETLRQIQRAVSSEQARVERWDDPLIADELAERRRLRDETDRWPTRDAFAASVLEDAQDRTDSENGLF